MGGGAMRAAAKLAGITVSNGGIPIFSATRRAASSRSTAAAVAAVDDVKMAASQTPTGIKTNSSEIEDWVLAGGDESILSHGDVMPRVDFGGPPTLQEAKDATSELAVALNEVYLSSPDSIEYEYDSLVPSETAVPAHALQAFRFLHESQTAQNVVASIASDPNVWEAVLRNQELQEFVQSQRAAYASSNKNQPSVESSEVGSDPLESQHDIGLMNVVQRVRFTVVDMIMTNLSVFFKNIFGDDEGVGRIFPATNSVGNSSAEAVMETSFVGLAVMAIMVIIVKRE